MHPFRRPLHFVWLMRDLVGHAWVNQDYGTLILVIALLLGAMLIVVTQTAAPLIYTIF